MKRKLLLNGEFVDGAKWAELRSPYDSSPLSQVAQASAAQAEEALKVAHQSRSRLQALSTGARREVLLNAVAGMKTRADELAQVICEEAGKPISAAKTEVARAIETFTLAASALSHFGGQVVPVDFAAHQVGTECEVRRFPTGVVVGVVPFNFPLNLGAHKVAPALAVGAPIIVKPPPQAPSAQLILGEIVRAAGADPAAMQVLPCDNTVAEALATDPRVRVLSFTGSARVGWHLKTKARGKVVLELGGNAAAIVARDADLELAAKRLALSAFTYAGQVCIKVQRIVVEAAVYDAFVARFVDEVSKLPVGDPKREQTVVGPVIDDGAATRIGTWVDEALERKAKALINGRREGRMLAPTVLTGVPRELKVYREEVFGPVAVLAKAASFEAAIDEVNDSDYGLQAGLFTRDWRNARQAFHALEVGGVIVDDGPNFRSDNMPYGGVKGSGLSREGVLCAMEDFTEPRTLVWRGV